MSPATPQPAVNAVTIRAWGAAQAPKLPTAPSEVQVTVLSVVVAPAAVFHDGSAPLPVVPPAEVWISRIEPALFWMSVPWPGLVFLTDVQFGQSPRLPFTPACPVTSIQVTEPSVVFAPAVSVQLGSVEPVLCVADWMAAKARSLPASKPPLNVPLLMVCEVPTV